MKHVCVPAVRILTKNLMKDFQILNICVHPHLVGLPRYYNSSNYATLACTELETFWAWIQEKSAD